MTDARAGDARAGEQPDVLIVGGGVLGLWLLGELRDRHYHAVLLERRELGGEQTCHSHVYIHEGHLYREAHADLARRLRTVHLSWSAWLSSQTVARGFEPSCFGFKGLPEADGKLALWAKLELPINEVDPPGVLEGGVVRRTFQTRECCLTGESLVDALRAKLDHCITLVDDIESISVAPDPSTRGAEITGVRVRLSGTSVDVRPRALVLAAGARNQPLLDLVAGGRQPLKGMVQAKQQLRLAHMLVIRGAAGRLAPLTGIFPDVGGLFLVSRVTDDEVVWLVSDDRSPLVDSVEEWLDRDTREWLPRMLLSLRQIAPKQFADDHLPHLQWGVYAAPKAEGRASGALPDEERIEQCGIRNMWAVWPTKLTLAPIASLAVTDAIVKARIDPSGEDGVPASWRPVCRRPDTAPERWRQTPLIAWDDFRRCHRLEWHEMTEKVGGRGE